MDSYLMSLELFSAEEHQKLIDAERRYGNAFINAYNTTILLSNLMMWPVIDCDLFIRFYSQMKILRIYMGWPIVIGSWTAPMWVSWTGFVVGGGLSYFGLILASRS